MQQFRTLLANSTAVVVKASSASVKRINIVNRHNAIVYVKLYDKATAPDPASDVPVLTILVPASGTVFVSADELVSSDNSMHVRAVTDIGDTGTTAPATLPIIEIGF
jgi:hypothetical protein